MNNKTAVLLALFISTKIFAFNLIYLPFGLFAATLAPSNNNVNNVNSCHSQSLPIVTNCILGLSAIFALIIIIYSLYNLYKLRK